jgi:succinyl-diaminopimelate desuccinylase
MRQLIQDVVGRTPGARVDIKRLLLARAMSTSPGQQPLVQALQKHGQQVFGVEIPACGTPLYTDARLFGEAGISAVLYGAGPRTVLESNAKRADEYLVLDDLRKATKVLARTLHELLP